MEITKWRCHKCGKVFYTEGIGGESPVCQCSWNSDVRTIWIDMKPTKRVWDEILASGSKLRPKWVTKKDAWIFSAHCMAETDEEAEDLLNDLPF